MLCFQIPNCFILVLSFVFYLLPLVVESQDGVGSDDNTVQPVYNSHP